MPLAASLSNGLRTSPLISIIANLVRLVSERPPAASEAVTSLARDRAGTFDPHSYDERLAELGEVRLNYSVLGEPGSPALLLVPGQTESWWGYERAMPLLAGHFQVYAGALRADGDRMGRDAAGQRRLIQAHPIQRRLTGRQCAVRKPGAW
jgi:hypothetical protein